MIYDDLFASPSPCGYVVSTDVVPEYDADDLTCPAPGADSRFNAAVCLNGALGEVAKPQSFISLAAVERTTSLWFRDEGQVRKRHLSEFTVIVVDVVA